MRILSIWVLLLLPFAGFSHGYWMEVQGSHTVKEAVTVRMYYGEYSSGEKLSGKPLDKMKDIKVFVHAPGGANQEIVMKQLPDYWEGSFIPEKEGTYQLVGINDTREVQDWTQHHLGITRPIQYLETNYQVGSVVTKPFASSFLNVQLQVKDGQYEILVLKNNSPLAGAEVTVSLFGKQEKVLRTDKEGKTGFQADAPGVYLVGTEWIDQTPGSFKEKKYQTVRHKLDYSLYHTR